MTKDISNLAQDGKEWKKLVTNYGAIRELKKHDEVHDDDVCWLGKDWNENVSFGGKKET